MEKHSPAPWSHEYGDIYSGDLGSGEALRVVARKDFCYNDRDPQWLADARLIAEVPAFLALARYAAERGEGDAEMAREILARIDADPDV